MKLFAMPLAADAYEKLWRRAADCLLTGKGRTIAIIDGGFWAENPLYKNNIISYANRSGMMEMHGAAVTSIAVGEIGVARDAFVRYYERTPIPRALWHDETAVRQALLGSLADCLEQVLSDVRGGVPVDCVSLSFGWMPKESGSEKACAVIDELHALNVPTFYSHNDCRIFPINEAGNVPWGKRDAPCPPKWIAIPIQHRPFGCFSPEQVQQLGSLTYTQENLGISWAIPFLAGMLALAREAQPDLRYEAFMEQTIKTALPVDFGTAERPKVLPIASPVRLARAMMGARGAEGPTH